MAVLPESPVEKKEESNVNTTESTWQEVYAGSILPHILADYETFGHDSETKKAMEGGMNRIFEDPYTEEFALVAQEISRKDGDPVVRIDSEKARQIFFIPWPSDMSLYSRALLLKGVGGDDEKRVKRIRGFKYKLLSLFYTLHGKDNTLLERFVQHDGMEALSVMLLEDNGIIQSQALELMHRIVMLNEVSVGIPARHVQTRETRFVMHMKPDVSNPRQLHAMNRLHACFTGDNFFQALHKILMAPEEVFPNSHSDTMKLLAMSLNWLHRGPEFLGCEDVNPSRPLRAATGSKTKVNLREGVQNFLDGGFGRPHPECQQVAENLIAGGAPLLEAGAACDPASDPFASLLEQDARAEFRKALFAAETRQAEDTRFASLRLKAAGAIAFKAGRLPCALDCYRLACPFASVLFSSSAPGMPVPTDTAEAERQEFLGTLRSNEAAVLLKLERWEEAYRAASAAADADPKMPKAHYRKAEALLKMAPAMASPCLKPWREADASAARALELVPNDKAVAALRERAGKALEEQLARGDLPEEEPERAEEAIRHVQEEGSGTALNDMD